MHIPSPLGEGVSLLPRQFNNDSVCTTKGCEYISDLFKNSINFNINPCDDFYEYTCSNWVNEAEISPADESVGTVRELMNRNTDALSEVLHENFDQYVQRVSQVSPDGLTLMEGQEAADRENFNKMKNFYDSCMNVNEIAAKGVKPLYKDISDLFTDLSYSQCKEEVPFDGNNVVRFTDVLINLKDRGVDAFIEFQPRSNTDNSSESIFLLQDPPLTLRTDDITFDDLYKKNKTMTEYHDILSDLLKSVMGKPKDTSAWEVQREKDMELFRIPQLSDDEINEMVSTFIWIEKKICSFKIKQGEMPPSGKVMEPWTLNEANEKFPIVDWERYLRHFLPQDIPTIDTVVAKIPDVFIDMANWLTNNGTYTVSQIAIAEGDAPPTYKQMKEYLVMKTIISSTSALPNPIYNEGDRIVRKLVLGSSGPPARSRICVESTSKIFEDTIGRFFSILKFGGEAQRLKADSVISNLLQKFKQSLYTNDWLDDSTTKNALDKIDKVIHAEGYNIISPDLRNATLLRERIKNTNIVPNDYYSNLREGRNLLTKKTWSSVGKLIDKNKWFMPAFTVNAYYSPSINSVVIPAGLLQVPLYDWDLPDYLNYGGIGSAIGHEITHGFDIQGRVYDGDGNIRNWWTDETTNDYVGKAVCFYTQYSQFSIKGADGEDIPINPMLTLGENLADNGGLGVAWRAYKEDSQLSPKSKLRLPGLEQLTPDQLFFINFAYTHCSKTRPEALAAQVASDSHAPGNVRVTVSLRNSPGFAEAFNCPLHSPMNPPEKCKIW